MDTQEQNQKLAQEVKSLAQTVEELRQIVQKNNFSSLQVFDKTVQFNNKIKVFNKSANLASCQTGELSVVAGKLYICSATDTWTTVNDNFSYTTTADYTTTQTVTLTPGFIPKKIVGNFYAVNTVITPNEICISNGSGDKFSATTGICNGMRLTQNATKDIVYSMATFNDRIFDVPGYSATVNIKITAWSSTSVTLAITCAANWTIGTVFTITG